VTDAEGAFALSFPQPGQYTVDARPEPPRVGASAWASVTKANPTTTVALALVSGEALRGRVVDPSGRGVFALVEGTWWTDPQTWISIPTVRSDPETGDFVFGAVPAGKGTLSVRLPGRMSLSGFSVKTPYEGVYVIRVGEPGGVVRGRVTDVEGKPVAAADVTLTTQAERKPKDGPSACLVRAKTDGAGSYRVDGVVPGKVTAASALAEGFLVQNAVPPQAPWTGATVTLHRETTVDLVLWKGGSVTGRVSVAGTGAPVADATVWLHRTDGGPSRGWTPPLSGATDATGRYRIDGAAVGKWVLLPVSPSHYLRAAEVGPPTAYQPGTASAPAELTVVLTKEGEVAERDLEMTAGFPVRGRVVDPQGAPAAGAAVRARNTGLSRVAWQWGVQSGSSEEVATTAADGTFTIPGLAPRDDWVLVARKEPHVGKPSDPIRVGPGLPVPDVTLALTPGASIHGRVLDADGQPVARASVHYWMGNDNANTTTGADGAFSFEGVPAGNVQISAWGSGRSATLAVADLKAGERREGLELRFERAVPLSGTLVDEQGEPVASRSIQAQWQGGNAQVQSADDGTFTFPGVRAGTVSLSVWEWPEQRNTPLGQVEAPASDVRLVFRTRKTVLVSGRVTGPGGETIPLCSVALGGPRPPTWGTGDPNEVVNGEFRREVEGTPPFDLSVTAPRDARGRPLNLKSKQARVSDPSSPVVIVLEPGLEAWGRVVDATDKGVEGVRVAASSVSATTDATGAFALRGLESAEVELSVQPPAAYVRPAPVRVRAGDRDVTIRLLRGSRIAGRVLGPDGRPRSQVSVQASWNGGSTAGSPDAEGRFKVEGFPDDAVVDLVFEPYMQPGGENLRQTRVSGVRPGTEDLVVTVETGVSIAGTVLTADRRPATDVTLTAERADSPGTLRWGPVQADGTFEIGGLSPGPHVVRARRSRSSAAAAEPVRVEAPARGVRIEIAPFVTVTGRLEGAGDLSKFRVGGWVGGTATYSKEGTGPEGTFAIDLPAGIAHRLVATRMDDDRYALLDGYVAASSTVVLRVEVGASIDGVVEGIDAAQRTAVTVTTDNFRSAAAVDAEGRFRFRGLPPGRYRLEGWNGSRKGRLDDVEAGASGIRLRVAP
jgi:protocatechuate 3,4-dioxygenase beta subunit